jgi:hypothetical protein
MITTVSNSSSNRTLLPAIAAARLECVRFGACALCSVWVRDNISTWQSSADSAALQWIRGAAARLRYFTGGPNVYGYHSSGVWVFSPKISSPFCVTMGMFGVMTSCGI